MDRVAFRTEGGSAYVLDFQDRGHRGRPNQRPSDNRAGPPAIHVRNFERILVDGDQVAWRWSMRGRHTGEFMGVPPSGNEVEIGGNDIGVMRDGELAEIWLEIDNLDVMTQLGAIEVPTG